MHKLNEYSIESYFLSVVFSIETLMKEVMPVVTEENYNIEIYQYW